jgi:hypothetical protein
MRLMVGFLVLNCPRVDMVAVGSMCVGMRVWVCLAVQRKWVLDSGGG